MYIYVYIWGGVAHIVTVIPTKCFWTIYELSSRNATIDARVSFARSIADNELYGFKAIVYEP